jgi:crotonobetainyl-CoA:carnitine CoA-transferase CaiB-like acyl-CoA transferase
MGKENAAPRLPLAGVVVIELGHSVAAPFAGQILGDLGAEVIKVEKPGKGDDARGWGPPFAGDDSACFMSLNRNKQSVVVDLKDAGEIDRLHRLIVDRADVVLQNLRPGTAHALGLGAQDLRAEKPGLVYCNLGAFGRKGPLSDRPGYDPLMQAYGGIMSVTGEEGRPPVRVGVSLVDMATGMWAVVGILSALHERTTTGHGREVDVSLYESALAWMTVLVANYSASGELPKRLGSGAVITAPYQAFKTQDGYIVIAAGNGTLFRKMCEALEHPEWADDARFLGNEDRLRNKEVLAVLIEAQLARGTTAHWVVCLEQAGVPCAPIQDTAQVLRDPQTLALDMLQNSARTGLTLMGLPIAFDGERPGLRREPPTLGEHTGAVFGGPAKDVD